MIKTIVVPKENMLHISIPDNYVGKEVEVLLYAVEETLGKNESNKSNAERIKGLFTKEEGEKYLDYVNQARSEWDRNI